MNYFEDLKFDEILSKCKNSTKPSKKIKIAILRNITVDNLTPFIKYALLCNGYDLEIYMGDFDSVIPEVMNSESNLYKFEPDWILSLINLDLLLPKYKENLLAFNQDKIQENKNKIEDYYDTITSFVRKNTNAKLIFNNIETNHNSLFGEVESQGFAGENIFINSINERINNIAQKNENIYVLDLDRILRKLGYDRFYDKKFWYMAKMPYSNDVFKEITYQFMRLFRAVNGKTKKCLVLDCDNTLWGGIIGEDGINKIKLGKTYPGNIFVDFQKHIQHLSQRGVILAINSKNNLEDVLNVLENHPDMILHKDNFSSIYANWNNKADNLIDIAKDINIGIDSLVFVDDNPAECELVRKCLPEVTVIELPTDKSRYVDALKNCDLFDTLTISKEDKNKNDMYRAETERKKDKEKFSNLNEYYQSLEMKLEINKANEFSIPRIAQLCQKTNQFNLTTKRYTEDDIKTKANSPQWDIYTISVQDKFGDLGLVGAILSNYKDENTAHIDTFLMSCRALGRGIEKQFLTSIIAKLKVDRQINKFYGYFIKTEKNCQVKDFFDTLGFKIVDQKENEKTYILENPLEISTESNIFQKIEIRG